MSRINLAGLELRLDIRLFVAVSVYFYGEVLRLKLWNAEKFATIISINRQNGRDFFIICENKTNFTLKMNFVTN
jgi:hypothetical protein